MKRRQNILSKTNNCQLKCPVLDKTLVEREAKPDRYQKSIRFTNEKRNVIARRNAEAIRKNTDKTLYGLLRFARNDEKKINIKIFN
ncbi:MAG: hypothetical protein LBK94_05475 [Prevotellaceae bacterium]|jgi:hypothetical protein|nr:hypothetical protein [Prevotellaceae bacterium]